MEIKSLQLCYQRLSGHYIGPIFVIGFCLRGMSTVYDGANLYAEHELLIGSHLDQTERSSRCTTVTFPGCLHVLRRPLLYVEYRTHNSIWTNATNDLSILSDPLL